MCVPCFFIFNIWSIIEFRKLKELLFMEERIIELEKKVAYQEHMIEELNEALVLQQKNITEIEKKFSYFKDNLNSGDFVKKQEDEDIPPHY